MRWTILAAIGVTVVAYAAGLAGLVAESAGRDDALAEAAAGQMGRTVAFLSGVGLAHVAIGLVCGLAAALLAKWAFPRRPRVGPVLCLVLVFFWMYGRDVAARPVFWEPILYQPGGILRAAMVLVTDMLSPRILDVSAWVALASLLCLGWVARRGRTDGRAIHRLASVAAAVAAALAMAVVTALEPAAGASAEAAPVRPAARERSTTEPPNVILLGVDSMRADRLAALGCRRVVLPNIDALAARGVVFRDAFVPLARTLPSVATLLTGTDPHTHGLRHMFPPAYQRKVRPVTLPAWLRARGYRSEVVTDYAGEMFRLVDLGFDAVHGPRPFSLSSIIQYEAVSRMPAFLPLFNNPVGHRLFPVLRFLPANADPQWMASRVLDRLAALDDGGRPFMLMGFFTGCHTPYASRWPGYRLFTDRGYQGPNKYAFFARRLEQLAQLEDGLPAPEVEQIRSLYDGACRLTDAAIGRVLGEARRRGLWKNTIFVIFADHGEHLYEPGNTSDHGKWFRGDEANRIPLVLAGGPIESGAKIVDGVVRGVDLMPTLLGLLGLPVPASVEGVDLGPRIRGEPAEPLAYFGETGVWLDSATTFRDRPEALTYPSVDQLLTLEDDDLLVLRSRFQDDVVTAKHRCVRTDRWKLVYFPTRKGVRYELYDVVRDPANRTDLAAERPAVVARLVGELRRWMLRDPARRFNGLGHLARSYDYFE